LSTLQMLGTGNAFSKKYGNTNALLTTAKQQVLIDCGVTATLALHRLNKPLDQIDGILITHLHADHVGGLEEVAFRMMYEFKKKPILYVPSSLIKPLWENCLKAGLENPLDGLMRMDDYFQIVSLETKKTYQINPELSIEMIKTEHVPGKDSFSIIINEKMFYSSDMRFDQELLHYIDEDRNCSIVLHDCQLSGSGVIHATVDELLTLPLAIQEKIHLFHYEDTVDNYIGITGLMSFVLPNQVFELMPLSN
jgi:hydroxyacylglutathione hydrolase